jgi:hypothetical protein
MILCALTVNLCAAGPVRRGGEVKVGGGRGEDSYYHNGGCGASDSVSADREVLRGAARASYRADNDLSVAVQGAVSDADTRVVRIPPADEERPENPVTERRLISTQAIAAFGWTLDDPQSGELFGVELGFGFEHGGQAGGATYHPHATLWAGMPSLIYGWVALNDPAVPSLHVNDVSFGLGGDYGRFDWSTGLQHTGASAAMSFEVIEDSLALGVEGFASLDDIWRFLDSEDGTPDDFLDQKTYNYFMVNIRYSFDINGAAHNRRKRLDAKKSP